MTEKPKDDRNSFMFRITPDQQEALDMAKAKAVRISGFAPTNKAIGEGMLAEFCEKYGVQFPRTPPKSDRGRACPSRGRRKPAVTTVAA